MRERGNKGSEGRRRRKRKGEGRRAREKQPGERERQSRITGEGGNSKIIVWAKAHHPLPLKNRLSASW